MLLALGAAALAGDDAGLLKAVERGKEAKVERLLERGADVNAAAAGGRTALHIAVERGDAEMVALLVEKGADVDARDAKGRTPLHLAAQAGDADSLAALRDGGGDMELEDQSGRTPLGLALEQEGTRDLVAWHTAVTAGTYEAYKAYLDNHPQSEWSEQARAKVEKLFDTECTNRSRIQPGSDGKIIEFLTPSGKPCGKTRTRPVSSDGPKELVRSSARGRSSHRVDVPPAGGKLVIPEVEHDVGDVHRGDPIKHTFLVKNTGTGPLTIKAKPG
jgi:hypothetical protein